MEWLTIERVAGIVRDAGYKAKVLTEGDDIALIETGVSGLRCAIIVYPKESLQWSIGWKCEKDEVSSNMVNTMNRKYRFLKAFLDDDYDLTVQSDYTAIGVTEDRAAEFIEFCLAQWERTVARVVDAIRSNQPNGDAPISENGQHCDAPT